MTCILPGQGRPQKENMDTRSELFWWTGASFKPLRGMMLTKAALLWGILPGEVVRALQPGRVWHSGRVTGDLTVLPVVTQGPSQRYWILQNADHCGHFLLDFGSTRWLLKVISAICDGT
ncbi:unnamed protein product [Durusdinium trenchii]|uniref:Uncharacterized protein n=1 Tax=Durusdinium trenchii TaxID=1381693 RepID=A0ABP0K3K6_9DINO